MDALMGCLRRGMLSRDAMGWAGCDGAHPRGVSRKVVGMHEGSSAISRRPPEMRKPVLIVEDRDLDPSEPRGKSLQTRAQCSHQQRIDGLHSTLRVASSASERGDQLQLPLLPLTLHPITAWFGAATGASSPHPEYACLAGYLHRTNDLRRPDSGPNGPLPPWISRFVADGRVFGENRQNFRNLG